MEIFFGGREVFQNFFIYWNSLDFRFYILTLSRDNKEDCLETRAFEEIYSIQFSKFIKISQSGQSFIHLLSSQPDVSWISILGKSYDVKGLRVQIQLFKIKFSAVAKQYFLEFDYRSLMEFAFRVRSDYSLFPSK